MTALNMLSKYPVKKFKCLCIHIYIYILFIKKKVKKKETEENFYTINLLIIIKFIIKSLIVSNRCC